MTTTKNPATICGYSFGLEGLKISFTKDSQKFTLTLDPKATAEAFMQTGFIEDWTPETKTGEPIILFVDDTRPLGYGFSLWYEFVKTFPINESLLNSLIEARGEANENESFYARIYHLLLPLRKLAQGVAVLIIMLVLSSCKFQLNPNASGATEAMTAFFVLSAFSVVGYRSTKVSYLTNPSIYQAVRAYLGTIRTARAKRLIRLLSNQIKGRKPLLMTSRERLDIETIQINYQLIA